MVWEIEELVGGETALVFDREFSSQGWVEALQEAGCSWVIRLNTKGGVKITDSDGDEVPLVVGKGESCQIEGVYYRGEVKVNVAALWAEEAKEPLWVMGNLGGGELLGIYQQRMKIEQTFKDGKSLLNVEKVMSKQREQLETTLALVLLAYGLGFMIGEEARDRAYGGQGEKKGAQPAEG